MSNQNNLYGMSKHLTLFLSFNIDAADGSGNVLLRTAVNCCLLVHHRVAVGTLVLPWVYEEEPQRWRNDASDC